jgi:hypothetical protein
VFNKNMTTAQHGYVMVDPNDKGAWQKLELEVPIEENGYIYIYVANESMDNVDVYFDDMEVQLIDAPSDQCQRLLPLWPGDGGQELQQRKVPLWLPGPVCRDGRGDWVECV